MFLSCMCTGIFLGTVMCYDNVCKPNIYAGIKCPPPSKTISPITWFGTILTRSAGDVFGLQARDPVRQCFLYRMGN